MSEVTERLEHVVTGTILVALCALCILGKLIIAATVCQQRPHCRSEWPADLKACQEQPDSDWAQLCLIAPLPACCFTNL